ncbi:HyaD/HybD family hydrogenase maturation endopeptidase [Desulfurispira natronophila]|uniref:Hydrogenase maturation protease n=1 Tax=Desulfurispira natronophila TaxID=682562 RepID=A0A7W8DHV6_9BACT|nr:HyaD/HybD family hydrogenase maturation endopeptidase [Desulfurispira natronophila]MBB5022757.1 hydrogenase maturation protease [Desulfurispira natronophila]
MQILILGIGNILLGDEGIGVQCALCLEKNLSFHGEHQVDIVDGGTLAHQLIPTMARYDQIIILDAIKAESGNPGEVYFFNLDQVPPQVRWKNTVHEVEMLQSLSMMELVGDRPTTWILGITPGEIEDLSLNLSPAVAATYVTVEKTIVKHLEGQGVVVKKVCQWALEDLQTLLAERWGK